MSINCTNKCTHQKEGYCTLDELPSVTQTMERRKNLDCPYFISSSETNIF